MPEINGAQKLLRKVLERWENEGGRLAPDQLPPAPGPKARHRSSVPASLIESEFGLLKRPGGSRDIAET